MKIRLAYHIRSIISVNLIRRNNALTDTLPTILILSPPLSFVSAYHIFFFFFFRRMRLHARDVRPVSLQLAWEGWATLQGIAELSRVVNNSRAICSSIHVGAIRALIGNFAPFFSQPRAATPLVKTIYILLSFNATRAPSSVPRNRRARSLGPTFSIFQLGIFPIDLGPGRRRRANINGLTPR